MIDVNSLIGSRPLKGNYFAPDVYLQGDNEFGLLENRSGARLIALPDTLLKGLFTALEAELGAGAGITLFSCGRNWGTAFYKRFADELALYYGEPVQEMEMVQFLQTLKQCWKSHGWGVLDIDLKYYQQGFIVAEVSNTPWEERHNYVLWSGNRTLPAPALSFRCDKVFHVSPFMGMAMRYHWRLTPPGTKLGVRIENRERDERLFDAVLSLTRRSWSTAPRHRCRSGSTNSRRSSRPPCRRTDGEFRSLRRRHRRPHHRDREGRHAGGHPAPGHEEGLHRQHRPQLRGTCGIRNREQLCAELLHLRQYLDE